MPKAEKPRPKGKAIHWTAADLEAASEITPELIEAAKLAVLRDAPVLAALADAVPDDSP